MVEPCKGRTTHHAGCACHGARRAAEVAALRARVAELERLQPHPLHRTGHRCACCGREGAPEADTLCPWCREAQDVEAQRDRLQRACDEGLPREYLECPACHAQHIEGPRHDNPAIDGRKRPHHTHRCYGCGHVWDAGRWSFGADVPKPAPESAALDAARREGAEEMRERCAVVLAGRAAWADYRTEHHTAPGDDPDETRTQMDALDGALAAIRALPLAAPGGGS